MWLGSASTLLSFGFVIASAGSTAVAKPVMLRLEAVLTEASLVAEATVVEVEQATWEGREGRVRIRVTADPFRVFVGQEHLDQILDVAPSRSGPVACSGELSSWVGSPRALVVVDAAGRVILAAPSTPNGYELRGWCDFNACLIAYGDDGGFEDRVCLTSRQIEQATESRRGAVLARALRLSSGEPSRLTVAELEDLAVRLEASSQAVRDAAHRRMVDDGFLSVDRIVEMMDMAPDGVRRDALRGVVQELDDWRSAAEVARVLSSLEPDRRLRLLRGAQLGALDPATKRYAERFLDQLRSRSR